MGQSKRNDEGQTWIKTKKSGMERENEGREGKMRKKGKEETIRAKREGDKDNRQRDKKNTREDHKDEEGKKTNTK